MTTLRVLVVEDEKIAAETHAAYVARIPGFELAGVARSAREAARLLSGPTSVDLVLLDLHLPDGHGLRLVQHLRAGRTLVDVIVVSSARDSDVVRQAVSLGVVHYLLKPFAFAAFREKLEAYAAYRAHAAAAPTDVAQHEIDDLLGALRPRDLAIPAPKGISAETLRAVMDHITAIGSGRDDDGVTASEVAEATGVSRVTARRYLEHLHDRGSLVRSARYVSSGRPTVVYRRRAATDGPGSLHDD